MYRIIDNRSTGKTSRLLLLAKESNGIVVCANPSVMREKAYSYGIVGVDFLSYEQYAYTDNYDITKPIFIDELELFLKKFDYNISGYTISKE